jgi:hypothetical protein
MRPVWETQLKSSVAGTFITSVAYLEMGKRTEHLGPVGTQGIFGFTATDASIHFYVKTKTAFRYWRKIPTAETVM